MTLEEWATLTFQFRYHILRTASRNAAPQMKDPS